MTKSLSIITLVLLLGVIFAGATLILQFKPKEYTNRLSLGLKQPYVEIVNPSGFLNTGVDSDGKVAPVTLGDLVGKKVILVDFMTYSCINCQRTFPHVKAWYQKYKDKGLEIVGIHTPEFAFEKNIENVRVAMKKAGITYPVVLDNDYGTWKAYDNNYWPRKYLIDINGNIVYDHIGEGAYEETEMKIRELLEERAKLLGLENNNGLDSFQTTNISKTIVESKSPETYFGSSRNEYLSNGIKGKSGEQKFEMPSLNNLNALYLGGVWKITPEYAESVLYSVIRYRYNAKEVYIVADADFPSEVEVLLDGKQAGFFAGADVNKNGIVTVGESRLYKLIKSEKAGEHLLELRIEDKGVRLYAFTFG